jgi:uncharacterized OB-fold protein
VTAGSLAKIPASLRTYGPDLARSIGYLGAASCFVSLIAALEDARAGDAIAWVSTGDGVDAGVLTVERDAPFGQPVRRACQQPAAIPYGRYLRVRTVVPDEPLAPFASEVEQWRDAAHTVRLAALRCAACGHVAYPPQRVCAECRDAGEKSVVPLPRRGHLVTFTVEHLFPNPERRLAMGVVDLGDGVRFYCPLTDLAEEELEIGMPVTLVFRRLHQGGSFINYFWKATAAAAEEGS